MNEFPRIMYTTDGQQVMVMDRMEMNDLVKQGWTTNPGGVSEEELLLGKRGEILAQLGQVEKNLAKVTGKPVVKWVMSEGNGDGDDGDGDDGDGDSDFDSPVIVREGSAFDSLLPEATPESTPTQARKKAMADRDR